MMRRSGVNEMGSKTDIRPKTQKINMRSSLWFSTDSQYKKMQQGNEQHFIKKDIDLGFILLMLRIQQ